MVNFKSDTSLLIFVNAAVKADASLPWNDPRAVWIVPDWVVMSLASLVIWLRMVLTAAIVDWGT
jgi:hypothetical protein